MSDMTREQAIDLLDNLVGMVDDNHGADYDSALKMGIEALKRPNDCISRQVAIELLLKWADGYSYIETPTEAAVEAFRKLPSAEPEPLTDKEQRIFLAAMGREEKVCKQVDEECRDCREPYEDSLVRTCHEIERKVKGVLWT